MIFTQDITLIFDFFDFCMHVYRNRESLMSYIKSVEERLQEARTHINNIQILRIYLFFCSACLHVFFGFQMKDHIILSRRVSSQDYFTLQLSRLSLIPSDLQSIMGNTETEACQVQTLANLILQLSMLSAYCAGADAYFILSMNT